jgi:hypothetical protein
MRQLPVVGAALAVTVAVTVAACSSSSSPPPPASPLASTKDLTCTGGARACTSPGTVRWSVTLPHLSGLGLIDVSSEGIQDLYDPNDADASSGTQAQIAVSPGLFVYQIGSAVINAIDPATGRHLWTTRLPLPRGFTPSDTPPDGAMNIGLTAADGEVTAYDPNDFLWWQLNATTGTASPPRRLAAYYHGEGSLAGPPPLDAMPAGPQDTVLVSYEQVQDIDPATGSVRWQAPVQKWTGDAVIGNVMYLDNSRSQYDQAFTKSGASGTERPTQIQRIDLSTGRVLPALPLAAALQKPGASLEQVPGDPGALLLESPGTITRLNPATGRAAWTFTLPSGALGPPQELAQGAAPSLAFLVPPPVSANAVASPRPGVAGDVFRIMVLDLATGRAASIALGRSFPYSAAAIVTGNDGDGSRWNMVGSAMLGVGSGGRYVRLEGIEPQTGKIVWRGPWAGDVYVRGATSSGPPVIIIESCAPTGLEVDPASQTALGTYCDSERLYAINS